MAKEKEKQKVLLLRKKGYSYSQIRQETKVSKSTLSAWLQDFPLSKSRIRELRDRNPRRIERFRETMRLKREAEEDRKFILVEKELGKLSTRDRLIAGLFLYWGEGTKAAPCLTSLSNTDPDALKFFVHWLNAFGIKNDQLSVVLHLYKDMDHVKEIRFWSEYLNIPEHRFRKPYIKNTRICDITYRSGFGHGTCNVLYPGKDMYLYVRSALKFIRMHA